MQIKSILAAAALALAAGAPQASVTVFNSAFLAPLPGGPSAGIGLNGFGRNTSLAVALTDAGSLNGAPALVPYFDTWNLGTAGVTPGIYSFSNLLVEAAPGTVFTGVTFNSIDDTGARSTFLFSLNAGGTTALGSGSFTVRASCPIASCVWIDVIGLRPLGTPWGYGGTGTALPIPEPGTWVLFGLGLAGLAAATRRQRQAAQTAAA